ncbi:MAG: DUF2281 domain-containing protein [Saprospiraceae bacterium]|nr:DUF2281 domain-containing protein [Saprospiraceae bacterium]
MNTSEIKLELFREIDQLPEDLLLEIKEVVKKMSAASSRNVPTKKKRKFGSMKGLVTYMATDFNSPLEEFKDYMP